MASYLRQEKLNSQKVERYLESFQEELGVSKRNTFIRKWVTFQILGSLGCVDRADSGDS